MFNHVYHSSFKVDVCVKKIKPVIRGSSDHNYGLFIAVYEVTNQFEELAVVSLKIRI